jgi:putative aminopeptidase FrvX
VVIGIFGSEEPGCRGAEAFAQKHAEEYNKIDTTCVNFESLTETRHQGIFNKEGTLEFPKEIVNLLAQCCEELGYEPDVGPCPPIAGGTDARGLAKYGLKASSLIGLQYKWYLHYYHTDRDNMDMINKERRPLDDPGTSWKNFNVRGAMEMALKVALQYLQHKDKE